MATREVAHSPYEPVRIISKVSIAPDQDVAILAIRKVILTEIRTRQDDAVIESVGLQMEDACPLHPAGRQ